MEDEKAELRFEDDEARDRAQEPDNPQGSDKRAPDSKQGVSVPGDSGSVDPAGPASGEAASDTGSSSGDAGGASSGGGSTGDAGGASQGGGTGN